MNLNIQKFLYKKAAPSAPHFFRAPVEKYTDTLLVHRPFTVRSPFIHRSFTVHSPFIHHSLTVHSPLIHCSFTVAGIRRSPPVSAGLRRTPFETLGIYGSGCSKVSNIKKRRLRRRIFFAPRWRNIHIRCPRAVRALSVRRPRDVRILTPY